MKPEEVLAEMVKATKEGDTKRLEQLRSAVRKTFVQMTAENRGIKVTVRKDGRWQMIGTWEQFEAMIKHDEPAN